VNELSRTLYRTLRPLRVPWDEAHRLENERRLLRACERAVDLAASAPTTEGCARLLFADVRHLIHPAHQLRAYDAIEAAVRAARERAGGEVGASPPKCGLRLPDGGHCERPAEEGGRRCVVHHLAPKARTVAA
jgi:hypothetical protein